MYQGQDLKDLLEKEVVRSTCYVRESPLGTATGALLQQYTDCVPNEMEVGATFGPGKYTLIVKYYFNDEETHKQISKSKTYTYNISKKAHFIPEQENFDDPRIERLEKAISLLSEKVSTPQPPPEQPNILEIVKAVSEMSSNNNSNSSVLETMLLSQTKGLMDDRRIEAREAHSRAIEHSEQLSGGGAVAKKTIMDYIAEYAPMLKAMLFDPTGLGLKATTNKIKNDPEVIEMMQDEAQVAEAREGLKEFFPEKKDYDKIVDAFEGVKKEQESKV
ncbi:MAG: hypothetical protein GY793_10270 [Proteobacteria bacterium]|nr:hypothetical protein [Pseudomonadota bacterium]